MEITGNKGSWFDTFKKNIPSVDKLRNKKLYCIEYYSRYSEDKNREE